MDEVVDMKLPLKIRSDRTNVGVAQGDVDCRRRPLIADAASFAVFVFTIAEVLRVMWLSGEQKKALRVFFQQQGVGRALESTVNFYSIILAAAGIAFSVYLLRLYLSLQLFDRLPRYYHSYVSALPKVLRPFDWTLRLLVFVFLLVGLQAGFRPVVDVALSGVGLGGIEFLSENSLSHVRGADRFIASSIFLVLLFALFLFWDCFMFLCLVSKQFRDEVAPSDIFTRFVRAHLIGLVVWASLAAIFIRPGFMAENPSMTGVLVALLLIAQLWDTKLALYPKKGSGLIRQTMNSYSEPTSFVLGVAECGVEHDRS